MKISIKDKKIIICSSVLIILGLFALWYYLWPHQGIRYGEENYYPSANEYSLLELNEGNVVTQEFKTDNIHLKGLQYYLIHNPENATGMFHIILSDMNGKVIINKEIPLIEIRNSEWYLDQFELTLKKNRTYQLSFSADGCSNDEFPLLVLMNKEDACIQNQNCYMNGGVEGALLISYNFAKLESTYVNIIVFFFAALFSLVVVYSVMKRRYPGTSFLNENMSSKKEVIQKIIVLIMFAVQFILITPNIVYRLTGLNLDPSWRYFLNIANDLGLKYGSDVYFTYGPLGYICYLMNLDNSASYWLGIFIWAAIFAIHIILLRWLYRLYLEHKVSFLSIVMSFLCYVAAFSEPERDNYQLYLLILAIIIYFLGNKKSIIITNLMLILMFFCKFSTFTSGVAFITVFAVFQLIFNKDRKSLLLMLPSFIIAPVAYFIYNPSLKGLYEYVTGIIRISSGWMKTQQWDDAITNREYRFLLVIVLMYILLIVISLIVDYHKSTILISCSVSLFFAYKYSVTAHGLAMGIWLTAMLFSEVMLTIDFDSIHKQIGKKKGYSCLFVAAILGCLGIASLQTINLHNNFGQIKESLSNKISTLCSLNESSLTQELYDNTYIPGDILNTIGDATVTTYPWENGYKAVYTDLNMVYSPSIQNCNEFIPWLDQKVADYFYTEGAPEYILLEDETIYFHIKYLDNPLTWEAMKAQYYVVTTQEGFCLLKKKDISTKKEKELIKTEMYSVRDTIICPEDADYVKVHMNSSLFGKLKDFFWRTGMTYMTIGFQDGTSNTGVIIVPNMISGFSLDYVPQNIGDVSLVLNTEDYTKMSTISFGGIGLDVLEEEVKVEWFKYLN